MPMPVQLKRPRTIMFGAVALVGAIAALQILPGSGNAAEAAAPSYIGAAYNGRIRAEVDDSTSQITRLEFGDATAEFKRLSGERAQFVLSGTIDKKGDAGFTIQGRYGPSGFRGEGNGLTFVVDPAGTISGGGTSGDQQFRFSGRIAGETLKLDVQNRPAPGASPSTIRGITFAYTLETERAGAKEGGRKCKDIRYEMRPVANIGDGTMSMIQVPVCL